MREVSALKVRVKFSKHGVMKYIGHLDMMRYFQKAIRRAEIDIAYSEGFSPHQIMSFAHPLGVGVESDGEYFDIQVYTSESSKESVKKLNEVMAEGVEVLSYVELPEKAKTAMSIVAAADYEIVIKDGYELPCSYETVTENLNAFYAQKQIEIIKKTKKSEVLTDIKPWIHELKAVQDKDAKTYKFFIQVSTGSVNNLKPALLINAFYQFMGVEFKPLSLAITRKEVYADDSAEENARQLVPLWALGSEIIG